MEPDRQLAARAARRHGLFTTADVAALGFTRGEAQARRRAGRWEPVAPGVWRLAGSPSSWRADVWAGLASLGEGVVVSHRAAAALHGFDNFPPGVIEYTVPRARRSTRPGWVLHTSSVLPLIDLTTIDGIRVTSASRTVIDLAASGVSTVRLGDAIDSAVRMGSSSPAFLRRRISPLRGSGRSGVRRLDALMLDSGGHTRLERAFLAIVRNAGLPRPPLPGDPSTRRLDRCAPGLRVTPQRVVTEVSGQRGHASEAERAKDARRQNELQAEGVRVLEFTTSQVFGNSDEVEHTLRRHLR